MTAALRSSSSLAAADVLLPGAAQIERAWHLLTVLVRLGRHATAAELAARCALSPPPSTDLVQFLCRIPGSPLFLTEDGFVTISEDAIATLFNFLVRPITSFSPPLANRFRVSDRERVLSDGITAIYERRRRNQNLTVSKLRKPLNDAITLFYERKRKKQSSRDDLAIEATKDKRRRLLPSTRDMEKSGREEIDLNLIPTVDKEVYFDIKSDVNNVNFSVARSTKKNVSTIPPIKYCLSLAPDTLGLNSTSKGRCLTRHDNADDLFMNVGVVGYTGLLNYPGHNESFDEVINGNISKVVNPTTTVITEPELVLVSQNPMPDRYIEHERETNIPRERYGEAIARPDIDLNAQIDECDVQTNLLPLDTGGSSLLVENAQTVVGICNQADEASKNVHEELAYIDQADTRMEEFPPLDTGGSSLLVENAETVVAICSQADEASKNVHEELAYIDQAGTGLKEFVPLDTGGSSLLVENAEIVVAICSQADEASKNVHEELAYIDQTSTRLEEFAVNQSVKSSIARKQRKKSFTKARIMQEPVSASGLKNYKEAFVTQRHYDAHENKQFNKEDKFLSIEQKVKTSPGCTPAKCKDNTVPKDATNQLAPKLIPNFESYIIEEEEGSGGYGTVYKVQRKLDGKIFAVKCPLANAHSYHVINEMKILERFGGKNFVIKYEGSFKNGDDVCVVLEHVEHDRPEILKKEINVFELRWYGYCMFRALASLHKQGIVHRDVKPGNFLFSRKLNKGYLIDFNLANDLYQKFFKKSKIQAEKKINLDPVGISSETLLPYNHSRSSNDAVNESNKHLISTRTRKRSNRNPLETLLQSEKKNKCGNQAVDISGITSAKDHTSTRTPSADRSKEPIPYKGRKELIKFLHGGLQSPNQKPPTVSSQRKRIAAPVAKPDRRLLILTPMPLHSGGNAIAGAGMSRDIGKGKHKKEGPCVGTKGFRAPEVLFKSSNQGCKLDIWSAGVTLLYLMMGRSAFGGDPEQNIKEIAKLRGSEELWEVAKLHDCESLYPQELFDVSSLHPTELREWCIQNTRRPDFLDSVPPVLFDLVDKCLTVNPRLRVTAEEALMHEFFAPCHESLQKQRMLRRTAGSPSEMSSS